MIRQLQKTAQSMSPMRTGVEVGVSGRCIPSVANLGPRVAPPFLTLELPAIVVRRLLAPAAIALSQRLAIIRQTGNSSFGEIVIQERVEIMDSIEHADATVSDDELVRLRGTSSGLARLHPYYGKRYLRYLLGGSAGDDTKTIDNYGVTVLALWELAETDSESGIHEQLLELFRDEVVAAGGMPQMRADVGSLKNGRRELLVLGCFGTELINACTAAVGLCELLTSRLALGHDSEVRVLVVPSLYASIGTVASLPSNTFFVPPQFLDSIEKTRPSAPGLRALEFKVQQYQNSIAAAADARSDGSIRRDFRSPRSNHTRAKG